MQEQEIFINAENAVAGRLASFVAKKALQGDKVIVFNSERAIMTGNPKGVFDKYVKKLDLGRIAQKGPKLPRRAEMILRRMIRGMLPWKRTSGREAYRRIKCYIGIPEEYQNKDIKMIKIEKKITSNSISLGEMSKLIRQK